MTGVYGRLLELTVNIHIYTHISEERVEPYFCDNSEYFQYSEKVGLVR